MRCRPVPLLCVFVFSSLACRVEPRAQPERHWSLVSASTAPEDENQFEPPPPPSPIYPNPGLMGCQTLASCACDEVEVFCGDPWAEVNCKIGMPAEACHQLGIIKPIGVPGQHVIVDPECILAPPPNGPPVLGDLGSMLAYCGLQHEAHHACDDSYVPTACSEESAYLTAEACLRGYHDRQCMSTDVTPPYCQGLQNAIDQQVGYGALEACLCRGAEECTPCLDACKATGLAGWLCDRYGYPACGRDDVPAVAVSVEF